MALEVPVPLAVAVPWLAAELMLQVRVSLSASVACRVRPKGVGEPSSLIVTRVEAPSVMTGASLTGLMVTFTVMVSAPPLPSLTCTTKESEPL